MFGLRSRSCRRARPGSYLPPAMIGAEVTTGRSFADECKVEVEEPTWWTVCDSSVCSATTVVDTPESMVMVEPGCRVRPATYIFS